MILGGNLSYGSFAGSYSTTTMNEVGQRSIYPEMKHNTIYAIVACIQGLFIVAFFIPFLILFIAITIYLCFKFGIKRTINFYKTIDKKHTKGRRCLKF